MRRGGRSVVSSTFHTGGMWGAAEVANSDQNAVSVTFRLPLEVEKIKWAGRWDPWCEQWRKCPHEGYVSERRER